MSATTTGPKQAFQGLTNQQVLESRERHGANVLTPPQRDPWWKLYLAKFADPVIRILIIAAVIAILAGLHQGHWVEGVGIMMAIFLSTFLAFVNEHRANREFDILNKVKDDVPVKVIRNGFVTTVQRRDIVTGDIIMVEIGEEVPADGNVLEAVNLQVDESRLTGESVPATKTATVEAGDEAGRETAYPANRLLRGCLIADGHGTMEVTAVGDNTDIGKTARAAAEQTDAMTPLNKQLLKLSKLIGVVGLGFATLTFVGLVIRGAFTLQVDPATGKTLLEVELDLTAQQWLFAIILFLSVAVALSRVWGPMLYDGLELLGKKRNLPKWLDSQSITSWLLTLGAGAALFLVGVGLCWITGLIPASPENWLPWEDEGTKFLKYFMIGVTIIVVAVPEGLAMAVTLALAYSMRRMAANNNLVRQMHACETIGAATVICSDKTGTLTMNMMRVQEAHFPALGGQAVTRENLQGIGGLVAEAICVNSTAHLSRDGGTSMSVGNPTEGALMLWLDAAGVDYADRRNRFTIDHQWTFSTERKFMGTLGRAQGMGGQILHVKGAPEIVLHRCTQINTQSGKEPLTAEMKHALEEQLKGFQDRGMRTLGFAYHDNPPKTMDEIPLETRAVNLVWLGFAAIADPIRPEVPGAIEDCKRAGVKVKMVTGDNPATAKEIARQIGLWDNTGGEDQLITGPDFQELPDEEAKQAVMRIKVMARARPMDKLRLVKLLKEQNEVVAVTGDGTNDAPALNYADVGLAMGKTGTAVAKEAADIILLDDSFKSITTAIMWGRSLYQNIQRFLVFQLTINVSALSIAMFAAFTGAVPLTIMQLLWVNLIMDTFAALALATEPPDWKVMRRKPRSPDDFIISKKIAWGILLPAAVMVVVLMGLLLYFQGSYGRLDYDIAATVYKNAQEVQDVSSMERQKLVMEALSYFFTFYVLLQFWNLFNARRLGTNDSVFYRPFENPYFWSIALSILFGQILITQFGGVVFSTYPLHKEDWVNIIGLSALVLLAGEVYRMVRRLRAARMQ
jgi:P-type Ca2+ transporter type 2C